MGEGGGTSTHHIQAHVAYNLFIRRGETFKIRILNTEFKSDPNGTETWDLMTSWCFQPFCPAWLREGGRNILSSTRELELET